MYLSYVGYMGWLYKISQNSLKINYHLSRIRSIIFIEFLREDRLRTDEIILGHMK
jgi:hypothetical protein